MTRIREEEEEEDCAMHMHKRSICRHADAVSVRLSVRHVRELRQNE